MRITGSLFALAALAALGGTAAHAQKRITVGPRLDLNVARVVGDNQDDATGRTGIRIGAWASMDLNQKFGVQAEFVLSGKGATFPDDDASIKINYLQIPVLAQYRFSTGKTVNPYVLAGEAVVKNRAFSLAVGYGFSIGR